MDERLAELGPCREMLGMPVAEGNSGLGAEIAMGPGCDVLDPELPAEEAEEALLGRPPRTHFKGLPRILLFRRGGFSGSSPSATGRYAVGGT